MSQFCRVRARHAGTPADAAGARSCPLPAVDVGATRVICGERPLPAEVSGESEEIQGGGRYLDLL